MGFFNYLMNSISANTRPDRDTLLQKKQQVVTLHSRTANMPSQGNKLIANGYKLQTMESDRFGNYTWVFVAQ